MINRPERRADRIVFAIEHIIRKRTPASRSVQLLDDLGVGGHGVAEVLQRLLLGGEADAFHAVHALDHRGDGVDGLLWRIVGHVGGDGDLVLDGGHEALHNGAAHEEHADDEQRQEDGDDGAERRGEVAREALERLLEEVEETRHRSRTPPGPGRG